MGRKREMSWLKHCRRRDPRRASAGVIYGTGLGDWVGGCETGTGWVAGPALGLGARVNGEVEGERFILTLRTWIMGRRSLECLYPIS